MKIILTKCGRAFTGKKSPDTPLLDDQLHKQSPVTNKGDDEVGIDTVATYITE